MKEIGEGGNWKVYQLDDDYIFRIPTNGESRIDKFFGNFKKIKEIGLPTLDEVENFCMKGKKGLKCNNLNNQDKFYISPNSVYSNSQKELDELEKKMNVINKSTRTLCEMEDKIYNNKIDSISNVQSFIIKVKKDLYNASIHKIQIDYDSYFFGISKENNEIDYILADLDNIYNCEDSSQQDICEDNLSEFYRAFKLFIKYFVKDNQAKEYLKILEQYISCPQTIPPRWVER